MYGSQFSNDSRITCPFNKFHLIDRSRIQKHIVKCEKNYPDDYKAMCPYDAKHRFFKSELAEHVATCPMRNSMGPNFYEAPRKHGALSYLGTSEVSSVIDCTENWNVGDDDSYEPLQNNYPTPINVSSYPNISKYSLGIRNMDGLAVRAPRGFSEAMMREDAEEQCVEDAQSVVSSMCAGRGKTLQGQGFKRIIGLGRGSVLNRSS